MVHSEDYDDFGGEDLEEKESSSEFAQLLNDSLRKPAKRLSVGDNIRGEILVIGKEDVYVSTGTPVDGALSRKEILDSEGKLTCKVGDFLDLFVTQVKGTEIHLSTNPTSKNIADDLEDAFDMMLPIEGRVVEVVKGGVRVSIRGKIAFCPISQLDVARVENAEDFIGRKLEFLITKFTGGGRDIVVSRRKILEEQRGASEAAFTEESKEGTVVSGQVKRIEPFGAFVEVSPGVDGLVHVSEMAWSRVNDPNDIVKLGQDVVVKVLKTESKDGKLKISLSMKQVGPTPWEKLPQSIREGAVVEGKVTRCMKFGAFVELAPGIEGLIPLSEMSYTRRVVRAEELVNEGERITVKIKEIQPQAKRISLSLRDAERIRGRLRLRSLRLGRSLRARSKGVSPMAYSFSLKRVSLGFCQSPKRRSIRSSRLRSSNLGMP